VPPQILEQIRRDTTWQPRVESLSDSLPFFLIAKRVDLNHDGVPEFVVQGIDRLCGASWCPFWIYRRISIGYERLLDAGNIQRLEPQATVSDGYRDVRAWRHGSAWESGVTSYKFDGRRYRPAQCFDYNWRYLDSHGRVHELKRPRITPEPCD
jgi:hypothetical protein